jgi:hypothetical protein
MRINVTVTPNAKVPEIIRLGDNDYRVKVNARASEGRANLRLIEMLAEHFDVSKSRIRILSGLNHRQKTVEVIK